MNQSLISKPVSKLAPLIKNKSISPVELTKAVLDHAEVKQKDINAYISFTREKAEAAAKHAEQEILNGNYRGMYHGIPIALKDNIYIKDETTTMGSEIHRNFKPAYNATVVEKLSEAGAIFTGKLNMHEYAYGITNDNPHYGASRNPWNTDKITGGSSGGSGAAVAADMTSASLGTDTSGSIRIPAALCGVTGLKPTFGRVSTYGTFPLAPSQDHIGPMTKSIKDAAGLLEIIAGQDNKDPMTLNAPPENYLDHHTGDVSGLVIGIDEKYFFENVDADIEKAVRDNIRFLEMNGAKVELIEIPMLHGTEDLDQITVFSEASAIHRDELLKNPEAFGIEMRTVFQNIKVPSVIDYIKAQEAKKRLKSELLRVFETVDVLISPTLPFTAPDIGSNFVDINGKKEELIKSALHFMRPASLTGLPALSVPCGFKDGLPIGLQIIGPPLSEAKLLDVGYLIEQNQS
ncbi:amidase [Lacicoccus qingdaonensis]|uniref:Aspartyl/glutamyl-tRNA(Asn/Gln) amidotransferase subunit A n=1 Tax=Lacicoccus qingdaonensis TaxID=576118 RepID=A0A1G9JBE2_9BACL|nr:amidase [Salinicoccus qingdaonensis]SDL34840.1 aspartyl/glutamyl-tRNA(Asn/Gln) amidotransferase subunit A [Salinicoccus qingdaonensis]